MSDPLGSFLRECVSEDKSTLERLVLDCGDSRRSRMSQMVSEPNSHNTVWFGDEPSGSWWAYDAWGQKSWE